MLSIKTQKAIIQDLIALTLNGHLQWKLENRTNLMSNGNLAKWSEFTTSIHGENYTLSLSSLKQFNYTIAHSYIDVPELKKLEDIVAELVIGEPTILKLEELLDKAYQEEIEILSNFIQDYINGSFKDGFDFRREFARKQ